ncbi:MAG: TIR domain-containing protein [Sphingobacteriales bacterium]|nr:MAG: TIR domain-containing protein [Sphingobacteriales bacterium]
MDNVHGTFQKPYTYISFVKMDEELATEIIKFLTLQELPTIVSYQNLSPANAHNITAAIIGCDIFVFFMSAAYQQSEQYNSELQLAKQHKKYIIPISIQSLLYPEFQHVQIGNGNEPYILAVELAERIRELLSPDKVPSATLQSHRIAFLLVLLHERSAFRTNPTVYDGKKITADHSKVLLERLDDLDELDWMEYFGLIEAIFPSERHAMSKYNGINFPTLNDIADHLVQTLSWEEIKNIELIGLIKMPHYEL